MVVVVEINNGQEKLDEGCTNKKMVGVQTKQTTDGCTFPLRPNKGRATKIESNNSLNQNKTRQVLYFLLTKVTVF